MDFFAGQADVGGRRFPGVPLGNAGTIAKRIPALGYLAPVPAPRRIRLQGGASRRLHDVRAGGNGEVELKTCRLCEDDAHVTSLTPHDVAGV